MKEDVLIHNSYHVGQHQPKRLDRKEKQMTIDRFEGDYAVLETDEGMISIHRAQLPSYAKEGDIVTYGSGGFTVDHTVNDDLCDSVRDKVHKLLAGEDD